MNLLDAAYNVVHDYPGGADSLAPRVDKNPTTLSHEVSGTGTAKLALLTAEKITQRTGDLRILSTFAGNCGQMLVPLPHAGEFPQDDCMLRLADAAKEFGELCREVAVDLASGEITDNMMDRVDRECGLLIGDVHALRESLSLRNQAARAAHLKRVA